MTPQIVNGRNYSTSTILLSSVYERKKLSPMKQQTTITTPNERILDPLVFDPRTSPRKTLRKVEIHHHHPSSSSFSSHSAGVEAVINWTRTTKPSVPLLHLHLATKFFLHLPTHSLAGVNIHRKYSRCTVQNNHVALGGVPLETRQSTCLSGINIADIALP